MVYQLELEYPGGSGEDDGTYVKRLDAAWWDRTPTVGEAVTVYGLCVASVDWVIWPITDQEDIVIRLSVAEGHREFLPTHEQLVGDRWTRA